MEIIRYAHLNSYLKNKFGSRVLKICIDGGFTCPNRDGTKSIGGCIFCGERGAGENIRGRCGDIYFSIENQVREFLDSYRGERANKFIAYFQSFSGTYGSLDSLKRKYDTALNVSDKIIGLEIATRPDLINESVADLLASYSGKYYVCVELGLQTANDNIGEFINRQYSSDDFRRACQILHSRNIDIVAHIMVGLPNEQLSDILDSVKLVNECGCNGIKIHSTYVIRNTQLNRLFEKGEYVPITQNYYIDCVCQIISNLNKDIIIHRITADPPKSEFVAPEWTLHKKIVLNNINKSLNDRNIFQGDSILSN